MTKSSSASAFPLAVAVAVVVLSVAATSEAAAKREAGFYTTRFGRRSDPSMAAAMAEEVANRVAAQQQQQHLDSSSGKNGKDDGRLGVSVQGYDEKGNAVSCVYSGTRNFYICQGAEDPWSPLLAN